MRRPLPPRQPPLRLQTRTRQLPTRWRVLLGTSIIRTACRPGFMLYSTVGARCGVFFPTGEFLFNLLYLCIVSNRMYRSLASGYVTSVSGALHKKYRRWEDAEAACLDYRMRRGLPLIPVPLDPTAPPPLPAPRPRSPSPTLAQYAPELEAVTDSESEDEAAPPARQGLAPPWVPNTPNLWAPAQSVPVSLSAPGKLAVQLCISSMY